MTIEGLNRTGRQSPVKVHPYATINHRAGPHDIATTNVVAEECVFYQLADEITVRELTSVHEERSGE